MITLSRRELFLPITFTPNCVRHASTLAKANVRTAHDTQIKNLRYSRVQLYATLRHAGIAIVLALLCAISVTARAQQVPVVEKTLANGMRLLMVERHDEPTVAGGWVAHVGSSNERLGMTGIAHLFEHMMFKGTTDDRHDGLQEGH